MRPKGSAGALEARRQRAATLLERGLGIREVARQVGSSPSSAKRWKEVIEKGEREALMAKPHPGRPSRLSPEQREGLLGLLLEGPLAHGYANELWTLPRIAKVIENRFGVRYHPAHVWKILRACGWSCQKPQQLGKERDEEQIQNWRKERWPDIKKR